MWCVLVYISFSQRCQKFATGSVIFTCECFFFFFECVRAPKHQLWRASKELAIAHGSGGTTCFVQSSFARCDFVFLFLFQRSETKRNIIGGVACYPFPVRGPQNRTTGTKITISDSCGGRAFQLKYQITLHFQTIC